MRNQSLVRKAITSNFPSVGITNKQRPLLRASHTAPTIRFSSVCPNRERRSDSLKGVMQPVIGLAQNVKGLVHPMKGLRQTLKGFVRPMKGLH